MANVLDEWTGRRTRNLRHLAKTLKDYKKQGPSRAQLISLAEVTLAGFLAEDQARLGAAIFYPDGRAVVLEGSFPPDSMAPLNAAVERAATDHQLVIGPLTTHEGTPAGLSLPFVMPIANYAGADPKNRILVSMVDPTVDVLENFGRLAFLYRGAEIELVLRKDSDWTYIVQNLAAPSAASGFLRDEPSFETFRQLRRDPRASATWTGNLHLDGAPALTILYEAKDVPWTVVVRSDLAKVMAPMNKQIQLVILLCSAAIIFGGLLMLAVASQIKLMAAVMKS